MKDKVIYWIKFLIITITVPAIMIICASIWGYIMGELTNIQIAALVMTGIMIILGAFVAKMILGESQEEDK